MPNTTNPKMPHADKDTSPDKRGQHPADKGQTNDSTRDPSGPRHGAGVTRPDQANDRLSGRRSMK